MGIVCPESKNHDQKSRNVENQIDNVKKSIVRYLFFKI